MTGVSEVSDSVTVVYPNTPPAVTHPSACREKAIAEGEERVRRQHFRKHVRKVVGGGNMDKPEGASGDLLAEPLHLHTEVTVASRDGAVRNH